MTKIDFHSNISDWLMYVCHLLKIEYQNRKSVVVLGDLTNIQILDRRLWTFSSIDFIPHCSINSKYALDTPIVMTEDAECISSSHCCTLLNLGLSVPLHFVYFKRLIEVVGNTSEELVAGRDRYRFYRKLGYIPNHYNNSIV
ncbi:MAG: DNA polymerase III subunit chi [Burkholderia sp.]|nr:DNA polymerase III subunit chi [Burkholderia sp.]